MSEMWAERDAQLSLLHLFRVGPALGRRSLG